jgi:hypothetical protein
MVRLSWEAAEAVRHGQPLPAGLDEASARLTELGLTLEPLHERTEDRSLASWFRVSVSDASTAEEVAVLLCGSPDVESAYVEPPSAPPS